ncbi:MAG: lytic transglycosylase domain-containing protein [Melioribacteraceae bacterium]|nr:lytic transglycosylase domain-containing protein [Melioribacteraceae bacterium]
MNKKNIFYFLLGVLSTFSLILILNFTFSENIKPVLAFPQDYRIVTPEMPDEISFCGELVPLNNSEVRERIEREFIVNTYWHSSTLLVLKNANRWFPVIEPVLKKYNIPDDFKYMAVIESNLTNAVSPMGAVGFWQFMKGAADKYGLEVNNEVDERYNVEKSTEAACKYLLDAYKQYGSWTLAAGSYNMGTNGIENQVDRQKADDYYNLVLNDETNRFVPRIISMKYIFENPPNYGFDIKEEDLYSPLKTYDVEVSTRVDHFADFASRYGINYKILKYYNPWLRENYLTNRSGKIYKIKIPEEKTFN